MTSPRLANASIKSRGACLKACMAFLLTGVRGVGVGEAIQGKVIPKRINKSTWCKFSLGSGSRQTGGAVVIFFFLERGVNF